MILWFIFYFFLIFISSSKAQVTFQSCESSQTYLLCQLLTFDEELLPGTIIETYKFKNTSTELIYKITVFGNNTSGATYLSLISRGFECDIVIASRIDKEDFLLNKRTLSYYLTVSGLTMVQYSFYTAINDIDDNFPTFGNVSYICHMLENDPNATCTGLTVYDVDTVNSICNLQVNFISTGNISNFLLTKKPTLKSNTIGYVSYYKLSVNQAVDFERFPSLQIQIQAQDSANHTTINNMFIYVIDVQDKPPIFFDTPYYVRINEELTEGSFVIKVYAIDGDITLKSPIEYSLKYGNYFNKYFDINSTSGVISIFEIIDRESEDISNVFGSINITVIATETVSSLFNSSEVLVHIQILDINDSPAVFGQEYYEGTIPENSLPGVIVYTTKTIEVNDEDLGINGQYSLSINQNNNVSDIFEIYPNTGKNKATLIIRLKDGMTLDFEENRFINLTIEATQMAPVFNISSTSSVEVFISILDINDHIPQFENSSYTFTIWENAPSLTIVGTVRATDKDSGIFGEITYVINDPLKLFAINSSTGEISINIKSNQEDWLLGSEIYDKMLVVIEAIDGGGQMTTVLVTIHILDVNNNPPRFMIPIYQTWLAENSFHFTPSAPVVKAKDKDRDVANRLIQYRLVNITMGPVSYLNHFQINSTTGEINVLKKVDKEIIHNNILELLVLAYDVTNESFSDTCIVQIIIIDVNDNAPIFFHNKYSATVSQNILPNITILFINATDADEINTSQSDITYRLAGRNSWKFTLTWITNPFNGVIISRNINARLDVKLYNLTMEATDRGYPKKSAVVEVLINVTEINDEIPYFKSTLYIFNLTENISIGQIFGQVFAIDPDFNCNLIYSLSQYPLKAWNAKGNSVGSLYNLENTIGINSSTGSLFIISTLDREKTVKIIYQLQVVDLAAETSEPKQTSYATLEINISDVNDNPPVFQLSIFSFRLLENFEPKGKLAKGNTGFYVQADDIDSEGVIRYNSTDLSGSFFVDPISGQIILLKAIDREKTRTINFTVYCSDGLFITSATVLINVLDVNDNEPYFVDKINSITVPENLKVGATIATFLAEDKDERENARIIFYIKSGEMSLFMLSSDGILTLTRTLVNNPVSYFQVTIEIMDNPNGTVHFKKSKTIFINVMNTNNNYPQFSQDMYQFIGLKENEVIGYVIGNISVTDNDIGENAKITYEILPFNNVINTSIVALFEVVTINGGCQIVVNSSLTYKGGRYKIILRATDNGIPRLSNNCTVLITVIGINKYPPIFTNPIKMASGKQLPRFSIYENTINIIVTVTAYDNDTSYDGEIRFNLDYQHFDHEYFLISPISGNLSNLKTFDRETKDLYKLRVVAQDLGSPPYISFIDIEIIILDLDDNLPEFPSKMQNITFSVFKGSIIFSSINNSSTRGYKIGNVACAVDKDIGRNAMIAYLIIGDFEHELFYLDPLAGDLYGLKELDREIKDTYTMTIMAIPESEYKTEGNNNSRNKEFKYSQISLVVNFEDFNVNPISFTSQTIIGWVLLVSPPGTLVIDIYNYVIDNDLVKKNRLTYSILETNVKPPDLATQLNNKNIVHIFVLNSTTGLLYTSQISYLQESMQGYISMNISVSYRTFPSTIKCTIFLVNENQRLIMTVQDYPDNVWRKANEISKDLSNVLSTNVYVDSVKFSRDSQGNVLQGFTKLYIHAVNLTINEVMNGADLLSLLNQNANNLKSTYQNYSIIDVKVNSNIPTVFQESTYSYLLILIIVTCSFIVILLIILIIGCSARSRYQRKLKAYCTTSIDSLREIYSIKVPGSNMYENAINPLSQENVNNHKDINSARTDYKKNNKLGIPVYGREMKFDDLFPLDKFYPKACEDSETVF